MTSNPETLESHYEDSELLKIQEDLMSLKKEILEWVEPSVTKGPEKTSNGKVFFDYEKNGQKWEIVVEKSWNTYNARIKKRINNQWYTQKFWNNETYNFTASDKQSFNRWLWAAMDKIIGNSRDRLPNTGWKVYDMLNEKNSDKKDQNESKEKTGMPKWLKLDHWTYVYTVQEWDTESGIKKKLEKYAPLSYLKNMPNGINWYNFNTIPDNKLLPWLNIPVPKPSTERVKTISDFKLAQKSALREMKKDATYWNTITNLLKKYSEDHIVNVMTTYAKCECSPEDYDNKVWELALFRYEHYYKCPSYGYHHVLYKDAWSRAFKKTGISIGQCCNPKDSWKLFLAFCIEKSPNNHRRFFDIENKSNLEWAALHYNWPKYKENNYDTKLKKNLIKVKNS